MIDKKTATETLERASRIKKRAQEHGMNYDELRQTVINLCAFVEESMKAVIKELK